MKYKLGKYENGGCVEKVRWWQHYDLLMSPTLDNTVDINSDNKFHGANMGPIWGRQDPGGPHVGPMNFAIREWFYLCRRGNDSWHKYTSHVFGSLCWESISTLMSPPSSMVMTYLWFSVEVFPRFRVILWNLQQTSAKFYILWPGYKTCFDIRQPS